MTLHCVVSVSDLWPTHSSIEMLLATVLSFAFLFHSTKKQNTGKASATLTGIRVLFYSESFEFPKFEFGLRYNEDWVAETVKFGHQPRSVRLCCLLDNKDAVMVSWRDSALVDSLDVSLPKIELKPVPETESPITINGKIKAIVFGSTSLVDYFRPSDGVSFFIVDEDGIIEMTYDGIDDHKWKAKAIRDITKR